MSKHKKKARHGRFAENSNPMVAIQLSIPIKLLKKIETEISGDSRSEKLRKCVTKGYFELGDV